MNWEALGAVGEIVAAVAVLVTLGYLAIQIRQNTNALKSSTYKSITDSRAEFMSPIVNDPEVAHIYRVGLRDRSELSSDDVLRFDMLMWKLFVAFENDWYQHERSMLEESLWMRRKAIMGWFLSQPGVQAWWSARPVKQNQAFDQVVEEELGKVMGKNSHVA